jgi:hypothetical protein
MVDRSLLEERAESFDALVQFEIPNGGVLYRLKSIQQVTVQYDFTDEDRYSDEGFLTLVRTGQAHSVAINLILTADEVDTVDPPTDDTTVSYFLRQKFLGERVQLRVVQIFVTKAPATPTIRQQFTMDMQTIGTIRNVGGAIELPLTGRILDVDPGTTQHPILDKS